MRFAALFVRVREWWEQRRAYDYDSRDELYDIPPLVIPVRSSELFTPYPIKNGEVQYPMTLDQLNAKCRKAHFATHVAAEKWAEKMRKKYDNYSWGYTIQTNEGTKKDGPKPWFVRFVDK